MINKIILCSINNHGINTVNQNKDFYNNQQIDNWFQSLSV